MNRGRNVGEGGRRHASRGDRWRVSYEAVSWSFSPEMETGSPGDCGASRAKRGFAAGLFRRRPQPPPPDDPPDNACDIDLNADLIDVKGALDAVLCYEFATGFHVSCHEDSDGDDQASTSWIGSADAEEEGERKSDDAYAVQCRAGSLSLSSPVSSARSESDLDGSDLTDLSSSTSGSIALPRTPPPLSYAGTMGQEKSADDKAEHQRGLDRTPFLRTASPARAGRLNAQATTFVPSPKRPGTSAPKEFVFPTLNPVSSTSTGESSSTRVPSPFDAGFVFPAGSGLDAPAVPVIRMAKDEQGFYSAADVEHGSSSVRTGDKSRRTTRPAMSSTRSIVDRLRLAGRAAEALSPGSMLSPLPSVSALPEATIRSASRPSISISVSDYSDDREKEDDSGGWIGLDTATDQHSAGADENRSARTRDLFRALAGRRSRSTPPGASSTTEVKPVIVKDDDGWIEGAALVVPEKHAPKGKGGGPKRSSVDIGAEKPGAQQRKEGRSAATAAAKRDHRPPTHAKSSSYSYPTLRPVYPPHGYYCNPPSIHVPGAPVPVPVPVMPHPVAYTQAQMQAAAYMQMYQHHYHHSGAAYPPVVGYVPSAR
ncbi:unnamed protein product [Mycena citricolor]|uniref:Uncharacterized protein n=1 Tax=Mycena citricolor TaxID=2018698 RepID=A0AAD2HW98_9AGAR|nr:unnamed protein product [Mycena citricolor]